MGREKHVLPVAVLDFISFLVFLVIFASVFFVSVLVFMLVRVYNTTQRLIFTGALQIPQYKTCGSSNSMLVCKRHIHLYTVRKGSACKKTKSSAFAKKST